MHDREWSLVARVSPARPARLRNGRRPLDDRLLVVGWDGADWDVLDDLLGRGDLPHLAEAIATGARGDLESTIPTHSWSAWPTFLTGVHPGRHGVFDFVERDRRDPQRRVPVSSAAIRARTFLEVLSDAGREVRAANIPVTFPPIAVRGRLIGGVAVPPRSAFVHPPQWGEHLERVAPFPINGLEWLGKRDAPEGLIDEALDLIERRTASYEELLEGEWTTAVCVYLATDRLQHPLGAYVLPSHPEYERLRGSRLAERLRGVYRALDAQLPRLRTKAGSDATFVLMSDHGFRPVTRVADINRMLEAAGLARERAAVAGTMRSLRGAPAVRRMASSRLGRAVGRRVRRPSSIDWQHTLAYQSGTGGCVSLNLAGREPHGVVEPADASSVRSRVSEALRAFTDPETGERPVADIVERERLPGGPYMDGAPDLLLFPRPLWMFAPGTSVTAPTSWPSGSHRLEGILVASGGRTTPGDLGRRSLVDLAPTVLAFNGLDAGATMDGAPIDEIAGAPARPRAAVEASDPVDRADQMGEDDERFVEQHLRDLGYID